MDKKRIAFYHTGIGGAVGGGGAGRFFIDIYNAIYLHKFLKDRLYFLTDPVSHRNLSESNFFRTKKALKRFIPLLEISNRFKHPVEKIDFLIKILLYRIQLIHICQYYNQTHDHRVTALRWLPRFLRPKVVVNFVHCNFPYEYFDEKHPHSKIFHERFDVMFNDLKIDAVFSWYELFCRFVRENRLFKTEPYLYAIKHYCCDTDKFKPSPVKENLVVFAARLDDHKNPMMYLEALKILFSGQENLEKWKFMLVGRGPLEEKIKEYLTVNGLSERVEFRDNVSDMSPIFGVSKCFVSTQHYENFTSLSMNEAMASGNAIISRNVGQTDYYVRNGYNGYLLEKDTAEDLAGKIQKFISEEDKQEILMANSIKIIQETHNQANFINELNNFWNEVLLLKTRQ